MGSVIGEVTCPNCNNETAYNDYKYKTGEEFVVCTECGYTFEFFIKRNKDGKPILLNKDKGKTFDNIKYVKKEVKRPYCSISVKAKSSADFKGGGISYYTIKTKKEFNKWIASLDKKNNNDLTIVKSKYDRRNKVIIKETLNN